MESRLNSIAYSIVIPCYNSGPWLEEMVVMLVEVMSKYKSYEIVLVNDRSLDNLTWDAISRLAGDHDCVKGIDLLYNVGQFRALLCGIDHTEGNFVITMDDDLQHPPGEIHKLIEAMKKHPNMDCIMGEYLSRNDKWYRRAGSTLIQNGLNLLYGKPKGVVTTSFRIMTSNFAKSLSLYKISSPQFGPLILSLTNNIMNVSVRHDSRKHGASGYQLRKLVSETFTSVVNSSLVPLRIFTIFGFLIAFLSLLIGSYYTVRWCLGGIGVPGFTTLVIIILFLGGMTIAGIGIIGEYIGRIIRELTGMPRYKVRSIVRNNNDGYSKEL